MRVKLRQYNGNIRKWISEKLYLIKKKAGRVRDSFLTKGHEKLTIMFIPHNEKNAEKAIQDIKQRIQNIQKNYLLFRLTKENA